MYTRLDIICTYIPAYKRSKFLDRCIGLGSQAMVFQIPEKDTRLNGKREREN